LKAGEVENFLARLYTDSKFLEIFFENPNECFKEFDLSQEAIDSILKIDKESLELACKVFFNKKEFKLKQLKNKTSFFTKLKTVWQRF
jgi:hypothetical protein